MDNRYPNDNVNWVQLWFKGEVILWLCRIGAGVFIALCFILFCIANSVSEDAGQVVIWFMLGIPVVAFCILAPWAVIRMFFPPRAPKPQTWHIPEPTVRQRASYAPWPDPTPWKARNPLDLGPYRTY